MRAGDRNTDFAGKTDRQRDDCGGRRCGDRGSARGMRRGGRAGGGGEERIR